MPTVVGPSLRARQLPGGPRLQPDLATALIVDEAISSVRSAPLPTTADHRYRPGSGDHDLGPLGVFQRALRASQELEYRGRES